MILADKELRFGVAPHLLIDCAKQLAHTNSAITLDAFCRALGTSRGEASPVLAQMVDAGFFSAGPEPGTFKAASHLRSLAAAHVGNGITRHEAERLLEQVLQTGKSVV